MTRHWGPVAAIVFAGVLAYVVGVRLSESAMAVVIGVIFGVAASIPTSLILALALRGAPPRSCRVDKPDPSPPTVIVAPPWGRTPSWPQGPVDLYLPPLVDDDAPKDSNRRFHIIGGEEWACSAHSTCKPTALRWCWPFTAFALALEVVR